ncbi:hypothetical protein HUU05_09710 [candidate division KSB1 bacterium]|nr:hypothetical protein [candidate division KSB1 bacterium]
MPRNLLLYLMTAIPWALAYPPFSYGFLAYWVFIPFLLLLEDKAFGPSLRWGYSVGLVASLAVLSSNLWLSLPSMLAFVLMQPVYFALFAVAVLPLRRLWPTGYLLFVPVLWALLEYARSFNDPVAPSLKLGYTQEYFLQLLQYAPGASVYAVSFWVVSINVLLLGMWRMRERSLACLGLAAILLLFFALPYLYSKFVESHSKEREEKAIEVHQTIPARVLSAHKKHLCAGLTHATAQSYHNERTGRNKDIPLLFLRYQSV